MSCLPTTRQTVEPVVHPQHLLPADHRPVLTLHSWTELVGWLSGWLFGWLSGWLFVNLLVTENHSCAPQKAATLWVASCRHRHPCVRHSVWGAASEVHVTKRPRLPFTVDRTVSGKAIKVSRLTCCWLFKTMTRVKTTRVSASCGTSYLHLACLWSPGVCDSQPRF